MSNSVKMAFDRPALRLALVATLSLALLACAAGDPRFTPAEPAGFWWGLWHGAISIVSLVIQLFSDSVSVYESNNSGGWYDFGFLLGVILVWGGGCHANCKSSAKRQQDKEWEEVGQKVEAKVMRKMREWAEDENSGLADEEWQEIGDKVEKKLKRKLREWAEKD